VWTLRKKNRRNVGFEAETLLKRADRDRVRYVEARPFPHLVIDEFLPEATAGQVLSEFPPPETMTHEETREPERRAKYRSNAATPLGTITRQLLQELGSPLFTDYLRRVTGIEGLISDPDFESALRHFGQGGRLGLHLDGNWHFGVRLHRRLNLILYLNRRWKPEWGGSLELRLAKEESEPVAIVPLFNRCVIFAPGEDSVHGFPQAIQCPAGETRKSINLYYYTSTPPENESPPHGTIFI